MMIMIITPLRIIIIMIIIIMLIIIIIIMIIHLFEGASQDTRGRLTKQSGKGTTSSVCPMGIIDLT